MQGIFLVVDHCLPKNTIRLSQDLYDVIFAERKSVEKSLEELEGQLAKIKMILDVKNKIIFEVKNVKRVDE